MRGAVSRLARTFKYRAGKKCKISVNDGQLQTNKISFSHWLRIELTIRQFKTEQSVRVFQIFLTNNRFKHRDKSWITI